MKLIFILFTFYLVGCQTPGYTITDSSLPVGENRRAISAVIGRPRLISENGRELFSVFHNRKFEPLEEDKLVNLRYYTKVSVLGPRRPYEINVQVRQENFDTQTQTYVDTGLDNSLTLKRSADIKKMLNINSERQQTLDGENPF